MKAGRLKKVLLPLLSLSLVMTTVDVYAAENEETVNQFVSQEENNSEEQKIEKAVSAEEENSETNLVAEGQSELRIYEYSNAGQDIKNGTFQVKKGNTLEEYDILVAVIRNNIQNEVVEVTNDMVSGFDNMTPGKQNVTITYDGLSCTITVDVIDEQAQKEVAGLIVDRDSRLWIPNGLKTLDEYIRIQAVNAMGNTISPPNNLADFSSFCTFSGFNPDVLGEQQITVSYKDITATFTVEVLNVLGIIDSQTVPVGGSIDFGYEGFLSVTWVDAANPSRILGRDPVYASVFPEIDTTKPGVQNVTFNTPYGLYDAEIPMTMQLTVEGTADDSDTNTDADTNKDADTNTNPDTDTDNSSSDKDNVTNGDETESDETITNGEEVKSDDTVKNEEKTENTGTDSSVKTSPKTGDTNPIGLYLSICIAGCFAVAAGVKRKFLK